MNEQSNAMEGARECVRQIIRGWSDNPPKIEWLTSFDDRDTRFPVLHLSGLQGRILNMEPVFLLNTKQKNELVDGLIKVRPNCWRLRKQYDSSTQAVINRRAGWGNG